MSVHLRYATYRDSGVDWLGRIPAHWSLIRLARTVTSCQNGVWGDEPTGGDTDMICVRVADFDRVRYRIDLSSPTYRSIPLRQRADRQLMQRDLLLEKSGGGETQPVGAVMLYDYDQPAVCSNFVARMPVRGGYSPNFLCYLHATLYASRINTRSIKQSIGIQNLDSAAYLQELIAIPPLDEQRAIADFLDRETARIDALIAKKQRLIELLQEKRTALISHAVTKGLDAGVAMKESGVAWLGEVPAHWIRTKLKYVVDRIIDTEHKTAPFLPDGEFMVVRTSNIKNGRLITEDAKYTDLDGFKEWTRRGIPHPGDVIFTREAPAGEACVVPPDVPLCVGQRTVLFRVSQHVCDSRFIVYSIYGGLASEFVVVLSQGSTVAHFNMSDIGSIPLFEFSVDEQTAIADFLDAQTDLIDCTLSKIMAGVRQLQEYRTALISAAVTGKIDVRA